MDPLIKEWTLFLDRCLEARLSPVLFDATASQLYRKSPLPARKLATLLFKPRSAASNSLDPRVIVYAERLLASKRLDAADILASAFQFSRDHPPRAGDDAVPTKEDSSRWLNPPELDEIVFHRLHKAFSTGERPVSNAEAARTLIVVSKWMSAMVTSHTSDSMIQAMAGIQQHPQQQSLNVREALGMLVMALIENVKILNLLASEPAKDIRKQFAQALTTFVSFLSQTSLQIANRIEISQKEHDFHDKPTANADGDVSENHELEVAALQLGAVIDLPMMNTRAGLYVYLNSLLVARPLTDSAGIINYLHARYKVDYQSMATDLVTASFDVLANAMYRNESSQTMFCLKSFLFNKVPLLLVQINTTVYPIAAEMCITQALSHVDPTAFPAFSQGFDDMMGSNNSLADVRQDFLNACALHGLIPTNTIERLLGETPLQGPPETKYTKKELLRQCKDNLDKINSLIDEMENLDGNAGAIAGAVTEFITHLCETQMTMYLKSACNTLSRKPQALDIILQFNSPESILRPLCQFLDEWRYDGDQGEYQPVYDEFGAILILILAFIHRYDLTYHDLGIGHDSFVAQLLERGHHSVTPDQLTEQQGKYLGSWLKELYDSDKEGLSNEVFASCRPQDFYLIVPTLFSQTVLACSADVLSLDSVKGGLEYLHETFLLPALVGGLTWMTSHALKQTHQDLDVLVQIFHKLIRSAPTSGDAQAMHSTILSIVSSRLEKCFRTLRRRHPSRTDIEPLLQEIKSNLNYDRTLYSSVAELEQWTNASHGTLYTSLRHTVQQLSQWAAAAALQFNPPGYTHRLVYASISIIGASKTLRAIVDEIKAQSEAGNGAAALDIGVSIICAPTVENSALSLEQLNALSAPRTRMNLREMLKAEFDNASSLISTDLLAAETIVRLHRRVEAQLLVAQSNLQTSRIDLTDVSMVDVQGQDMPELAPELDKALNDAAAATMAAANGDLQAQDQEALQRSLDQHLDLSGAAGGLDLSAMGVGVGAQGGAGDLTADMGDLPDLDLSDMGGMGGMGGMGMDLGDDDNDWGLDFDNM
ncbi:mediator of RNA polymeras-like protein II transcription subunit 5 [Aaosphaeria arxii CBS 175.79]|uniref:Mediator of RNA polymerase II transcription subunit 5 n=1 Tax=Aaosphaeria arxii CBS 175.79 TaxID=1450172 RepID=A0A6A5XLJ7_9PLEO|nr:mediator of RNA polymeras-like protein II transcription subunit 5 [Aaosphaeria arxii CBS 175.79]KAF2013729.1 mediator of RNA polymeras-like protein II transcription subunit 5 [Aaosphaeria arxii CBS 175.79]